MRKIVWNTEESRSREGLMMDKMQRRDGKLKRLQGAEQVTSGVIQAGVRV